MTKLFRIAITFALPVLLVLAACNRYEEDVMPLRTGSQTRLQDDVYMTKQNKPTRLNVLANDSLFTNGSLFFRQPAHGNITSDSAGFIYTPTLNYHGIDQFYYLYYSSGQADSAKVTVTVLDPAACQVIAVGDNGATKPGEPVIIPVLLNDDTCGNQVTVTLVSQPQNGVAAMLSNGRVRYTPNAGFHGAMDSFQYRFCIPGGVCVTGTVHVLVSPPDCIVNFDAIPDHFVIPSASPATSFNIEVLQNDIYCQNPFPVVTIVKNGIYGTASVVMVNGVPQVNYLKSNPPALRYNDTLIYNLSCTYKGTVYNNSAPVIIRVY